MNKYRYLIYANILFLAAALTCALQRHYGHRSNHPLPTETEQRQMRYDDSIKFNDIKREVDYVIPD